MDLNQPVDQNRSHLFVDVILGRHVPNNGREVLLRPEQVLCYVLRILGNFLGVVEVIAVDLQDRFAVPGHALVPEVANAATLRLILRAIRHLNVLGASSLVMGLLWNSELVIILHSGCLV